MFAQLWVWFVVGTQGSNAAFYGIGRLLAGWLWGIIELQDLLWVCALATLSSVFILYTHAP